ncbi:MAG: ABC transporter substrate-binding protein [Tuberibacillus sp.]
MAKKILGLISLLIVGLLGYYLYTLKPVFHEANDQTTKKVEVWVFSPALTNWCKKFNANHDDVQIVYRQIDNPDRLLEELNIAVTTGNAPDMAEIPTFYGIYPLIQKKVIQPVEAVLPDLDENRFAQGVLDRFSVNHRLWAIPIGYSYPVVYINESMLEQNHEAMENLIDWQSLLYIANEPVGNKGWKFNTDNEISWYIYNQQPLEWNAFSLKTYHPGITVNENGFSIWRQFINKKIMPPLSHDIAMTDFVNGNGQYFISSSENINLIEKLISGKFNFNILPLKLDPQSKIMVGGSGLVLTKNNPQIRSVLHAFMDKKNLLQLSVESDLIPGNKDIATSITYLDYFNKFPLIKESIKDSVMIHSPSPSNNDEWLWDQISKIAIEMESKDVPIKREEK